MKIIANRISGTLDDHQSTNQAGFRSGYSTTDNLFILQQLIEKSNEHQMNLFLSFVDFEKAFDSVEHPFLWLAMKEHGVENKYTRIIRKIYENSTAVIKMEENSREIKIGRGIKQGCCLSPKQFNGALQRVFQKLDWQQLGVKIDGKMLNEIRFADDVVLISQNKQELADMMTNLFEECKISGLKANMEKTKILTNTSETSFDLNGNKIEIVEEFKYLGSVFSFQDRESKEIAARISAAWRSFWASGKFFQSNMPVSLKKKINGCDNPSNTHIWMSMLELY